MGVSPMVYTTVPVVSAAEPPQDSDIISLQARDGPGNHGRDAHATTMPLRAIIFDFDGLILDTETPEVRAWQSVFRRRGAEFPDSWWIHAIGRGADQIQETPVEVLERQLGYPCDHQEIKAEYELLRMGAIDTAEVLPGIRQLIQEAKDKGIALGVASSSRHNWVDRHLARLQLLDSFDAILCADDVESAKPFPDLYIAVCQRLGVLPEEAIALEDSPNGIKAAKSAGLFCVAIPNPCTIRLNLTEADHLIDSCAAIDLSSLTDLMTNKSSDYDRGMGLFRRKESAVSSVNSDEIRVKFEEVVAEMKAADVWDIPRPADEAFQDMGAFGMNTMALEQWIRWVFVPTIEDRLASNGPWPQSSAVGITAIRNFDGQVELQALTSKLCEFDRLFGEG